MAPQKPPKGGGRAAPPKPAPRKGGGRGVAGYIGAAVALVAALLLAFFWTTPDEAAEAQPPPGGKPLLQKFEARSEGKQEPAEDPGERLLAHLKQNGAVVGVKIASFPGGLRGVASMVNVPPEGLLMTIPVDQVLFNETIAPEVHEACRLLPCNVSHTRTLLALGAAFERSLGQRSRFKAFMDSMPDEVTNFVAWPAQLLKLMEMAMPGTRGYLSMELRELRAANALLPQPVDEGTLIWAVAMMQSRAFGWYDGGDALIAGGGLFNHHWDPEEAIPMPKCDQEKRLCYVLAGDKPIKAGQQVFFHYRPWSNLQLLIRYGFAVPGNPWGPEVKFEPLASMPSWLEEAGCREKVLRLRASDAEGGLPVQDRALRCARAAALAVEQAASGAEVQSLWAAGAFDGKDAPAHGSHAAGVARGYRLMAAACSEAASRWTDAEGMEVLNEVATVPGPIASQVMKALAQQLELLDACERGFNDLAAKLER